MNIGNSVFVNTVNITIFMKMRRSVPAVISTVLLESRILSARDSEENPPN